MPILRQKHVFKPRFKRTALDIEVARTMGTLTKDSLEHATSPTLQGMFHPHSTRGVPGEYPLSHQMHEFAKLPSTTVGNFVDVPTVIREVRQSSGVARLLDKYPQLEESLVDSVNRAIRERGIKSFKFWAKAPKEYIDWIVKTAKGNPNIMNAKVGQIVASNWGKTVRPRTILDIGTFAGGTALGAVQFLSPEQKKVTKMVLVDVMGNVVREHAVTRLVVAGIPLKNIHVIPCSFYNASVAFGLMPKPFHEKGQRGFAQEFLKLTGKVDTVIAGAATLNFANDLEPFLPAVHRLLKPGGLFVDWEWGSAESQSPNVNVPELKKRILTMRPVQLEGGRREHLPVTEYDAYVSFLNFWMNSFKYPDRVKEKLFSDIERSTHFNFFNWCEQNVTWMEAEREKTGQPPLPAPAGYRNRAYRTGQDMVWAAKRHGFHTEKAVYPLAKPGQKDTGNVNWLVVAMKKK